MTPVMPSAGDDVVVRQAVALGVDDDPGPAAGDPAAGVGLELLHEHRHDGRPDLLDQLDAVQLGVLDRVGGGGRRPASGDQRQTQINRCLRMVSLSLPSLGRGLGAIGLVRDLTLRPPSQREGEKPHFNTRAFASDTWFPRSVTVPSDSTVILSRSTFCTFRFRSSGLSPFLTTPLNSSPGRRRRRS